MQSVTSRRIAWRLSAALGAAALATAACAGLTAARAEEPLANISLPIEGWTAVAQAKGFFEAEYGKLGTKVTLVDPGSTQLIGAEAAMLDRGGLAVAQRMMYPATVHKANGIDASIIWLSGRSSRHRTPVLVRADSPVQSIADLKGKTFGSSRVSCGWTAPTEIFAKNDAPLETPIKEGKVKFTNISSLAASSAALLSGRIDATSTHVALPEAAALVASGQVKVAGYSPEDGVYVNAAGRVSYFSMRSFVDAHPNHIKAFLKTRETTVAWIRDHVDEAAAIIAKETRIPIAIAKFAIVDDSEFHYMTGEPSADVATQAIKTFQQWYIDNGDEILKARHLSDETIEAFVDKRFFKGGSYSIYEN
jgi:ABC-type nitrate/sulfonate/bicarbonate transport system substrate-binding protein